MQNFLTLLQTSVLGALAIYIAWRQWKTANAKLVIDLFEKRFALYKNAHAVIAPINTSGRATDNDLFEFDKFMNEAVFLFGDDVEAYLQSLRKNIIQLCLHCTMLEEGGSAPNAERADRQREERKHHARGKAQTFREIIEFYDAFPKLCRPYMKLDQSFGSTKLSLIMNRLRKRS